MERKYSNDLLLCRGQWSYISELYIVLHRGEKFLDPVNNYCAYIYRSGSAVNLIVDLASSPPTN